MSPSRTEMKGGKKKGLTDTSAEHIMYTKEDERDGKETVTGNEATSGTHVCRSVSVSCLVMVSIFLVLYRLM